MTHLFMVPPMRNARWGRLWKLGWLVAVWPCGTGCLSGAAEDVAGRLGIGSARSDAATVCPQGTTLPGIDLSSWNDVTDWDAVAAAGIQFTFLRVSSGASYPDTKFATHWEAAKAHGIVRGGYQFFSPGDDAHEQAAVMIAAMSSLGPGDLPPVLDVEITDGQSASTVAQQIRLWVTEVQTALSVTPIVYTGAAFWQSGLANDSSFTDLPLWVAHWGVACPSLPQPWNNWVFWQHSSTGSVPGIDGEVDLNKFNGDPAALAAFVLPPIVPSDGGSSDSDLQDGGTSDGGDTDVSDGDAEMADPSTGADDSAAGDLALPGDPASAGDPHHLGDFASATDESLAVGDPGPPSLGDGCDCHAVSPAGTHLLWLLGGGFALLQRRRRRDSALGKL